MSFTPEFMLQLLIAAGTPAALYAAIRADLARLHERTSAAHERLDFLQDRVFK